MGLREIESSLPPGFRFYPSDEELVCHYLYKKVGNHKIAEGTMVEVDLHTREPWELPDVAKLSENEWYFFSFRDRKYATGLRTNRATKSGYWKATGKDRIIRNPKMHRVVGMRKTLVFYKGRAPNGSKTNWVMHEFRLENPHTPPKEDWVLCRVFHKEKGETVRTGNENIVDTENMFASASHLEISADVQMEHMTNVQGEGDGDGGCSSGPLVQYLEDNGTDTFLNLAVLQYNFFDYPPEMMLGNTDVIGGGSGDGCEDELRFLMDLGLEEEGHEHENVGRGAEGVGLVGDCLRCHDEMVSF